MDAHVIPVSNLGINCFFSLISFCPWMDGCPWNISNLLPKLFFCGFHFVSGWMGADSGVPIEAKTGSSQLSASDT